MLTGNALREHALNRLGYGQSGWHTARYGELGFDAYVSEQLSGSLAATTINGATAQAKLRRSVAERRQLEVMLIDFWFNHFNCDASPRVDKTMVNSYQNTAIRPHVLGKFGAMLLATARQPLMLRYLDNRVNFREATVNGKDYGINENYARELMELHTLGVDGGYVERDVIEVARVLTGWSTVGAENVYKFKTFMHDKDAKTVMGVRYPAGGLEEEGVRLLASLAANPATAKFISTKLCRRLVSETPPASVVNAGAAAFRNTGGDLTAVTRAIVSSPEFKADGNFRSKVKQPTHFLASSFRAMGATTSGDFAAVEAAALEALENLGEEPYQVGPPTGYPEASGYWVSSSSMLVRFEIAGDIANNARLRGLLKAATGADGSDVAATVNAVAARMCPGGISASTRSAAASYVSSHATSNDQRVSDAAHAILSSPEFVRF